MKQSVEIDGVKYVREGPTGNRVVIVADRGWIFAGDLTEEDGRIKLKRAVGVIRWASIGFEGVLENPKSDKVTIKKIPGVVDLPVDAELFRIRVDDQWGL